MLCWYQGCNRMERVRSADRKSDIRGTLLEWIPEPRLGSTLWGCFEHEHKKEMTAESLMEDLPMLELLMWTEELMM